MSTDSTPCGCPFCEPEAFVNTHEDWLTDLLFEPELRGDVLPTLFLALLMKETGYAEKTRVKADITRAFEQEDDFQLDSASGSLAEINQLVTDHRTDNIRLLCSEKSELRAIALMILLNADQYDRDRALEDVEMFYAFQAETTA